MSWLVPSALVIAGAAAIAAIVLHFIARSRPLAEPLPTARFIPQRAVRARTRSFALSDAPLLLLRLLAILALGAAVAGPVFATARGRVARVIAVDRSRSVASIDEVRDSVRAVTHDADVVVAFDTSAAVLTSGDSLQRNGAAASVSTAIAAASRAALSLATRADSIELVIVSPLTADAFDAATMRMRAAWPGRIRLVRTRAAESDVAGSPHVQWSGLTNDAVAAGLSLMGLRAADGAVRLVRGRLTSADSAWVRAADRVLLHWPESDSGAVWPHRSPIDAIGAVASRTGTLVGRFPRSWVLEGAAVARWADGEIAAVQRPLGAGCIREVGMLLDPSSDLTLRAPFRRFVAALLEPCGGATAAGAIDSATVAALAGSGPLASSESIRDRSVESSRWTPWLLVIGAILLILELAARRSGARAKAAA